MAGIPCSLAIDRVLCDGARLAVLGPSRNLNGSDPS